MSDNEAPAFCQAAKNFTRANRSIWLMPRPYRRIGLTATLVREDAREEDVFSLIGPKKYDVPWKVLEKQGSAVMA